MGGIKPTNIFVITEESSDMTLFDCRWVPCSTRFVVAGTHTNGHGILRVYNSDSNKLEQLVNIERKRHPFKCITFGATSLADRQPTTGDFDGNINVWDIENKRAVWSVKGHSSIVNGIDGIGGKQTACVQGTPKIVTGSRDGSVKVWDVRIKERPIACMKPMEGVTIHDCWSVAFGNSSSQDQVVAAGFDNGDIKVFDLRNMSIYWETHVSTGVCSVSFDSSVELMSKLSATCLQGCVHLWDLKGLDKSESFSKFTEKIDNNNHTIWGGRFLYQNRNVFVTIDGSGAVKSWKYEDPKLSSETNNDNSKNVPSYLEKLQECQISDQPISAFDWSPDMPGLAVSTSFDQKVRLLAFTNLDKL